MNRYASIGLIVLLMISMCVINCGDDDDSLSPEETIKAMLSSWQDGDIEKAKSYFTEQYAISGHFDEYGEESNVSYKFYNIETSLLKQDENTAEVRVSYESELTMTIDGETDTRSHHVEEIVCLVKENEVWLIDDSGDAN